MRHHGECAQVHQRVGYQVEHDRRASLGGPRGKADQDVACVGDGRVGEKPLDVGLNKCRKIAERHRKGGGDPQDPESSLAGRLKYGEDDAQEYGEGGRLGTGGEEGGDRGRRSFVDVRRPDLERHTGNLEGQAHEHKDHCHQSQLGCSCGRL